MQASQRTIAVGDTVGGRYVVEGVLGEGGMAIVYRARHATTGRMCALKVIHPQFITRPGLLEQFVREAQVGARIGQSPHIVDILDAGADEARGVPFLAMELLQGEDLESYVEKRGAMPPALVREVFVQLADALDQAHTAGIVHRDLKPSNLFLTTSHKGEPQLKVVDFGIAKALETERAQRTATQIGTPAYAAPEQFGAGFRQLADKHGIVIASGISPSTDVWAMGLIAYELLTGTTPGQYWGAETLTELPLKVALGEQEPATLRAGENAASLPPGFDAWFARCVQRNAAERWPSAGEAASELSRILDGAPAGAPLPARPKGPTTLTLPLAGAPEAPSGPAITASPLVSTSPGAAKPPRTFLAALVGAVIVAVPVAIFAIVKLGGGGAVTTVPAVSAVPASASPSPSATASAALAPPPAPAPTNCPPGMAALPGGTYLMGERKDVVTVGGFCMDLTEVTAEAYQACVREGQCTADHLAGANSNYGVAARAKHPINYVDWGQATTYCKAQNKRLPTEEEWEWAARGGSEGRMYPWGNDVPDAQLCWSGISKRTGTCAAGSFPSGDTPAGIHDLAGNVWEWTSSNFDETPAARVARGGCWYDDYGSSVRARLRSRSAPASRNGDLGFRCAK